MILLDEEIEYSLSQQEYFEEMKSLIPKIVFKYRSLKETDDFVRFLDIVKNNRLYMPTVEQLNDPFEGGYVECLSEKLNAEMKDMKAKHRVLSLSANCFSTLMWSNYASEEYGVCIGFYSSDSFSGIHRIEYLAANDTKKQWIAFEKTTIEEHEFKFKTKEWEYEEEYRIENCGNSEYFKFNHDEIACIIIGRKIKDNVREVLDVELKQEGIVSFDLKADYDKKKYYIVPAGVLNNKIYNQEDLVKML